MTNNWTLSIFQDEAAAVAGGKPYFGNATVPFDPLQLSEGERATLDECFKLSALKVDSGIVRRNSAHIGPMATFVHLPRVIEATREAATNALKAFLAEMRAELDKADSEARQVIAALQANPLSVAEAGYGPARLDVRLRQSRLSHLENRQDVQDALKAAKDVILADHERRRAEEEARRKAQAAQREDEARRDREAERQEAARREADKRAAMDPLIRSAATEGQLERWEARLLPQHEQASLLEAAYFQPAAHLEEDPKFDRADLAATFDVYAKNIEFETRTVDLYSDAEWQLLKELKGLFPSASFDVRSVSASVRDEVIARRSYVLVHDEIAPGVNISRRFAVSGQTEA